MGATQRENAAYQVKELDESGGYPARDCLSNDCRTHLPLQYPEILVVTKLYLVWAVWADVVQYKAPAAAARFDVNLVWSSTIPCCSSSPHQYCEPRSLSITKPNRQYDQSSPMSDSTRERRNRTSCIVLCDTRGPERRSACWTIEEH